MGTAKPMAQGQVMINKVTAFKVAEAMLPFIRSQHRKLIAAKINIAGVKYLENLSAINT
jgi:hypothetical protein